ncbi:MAG: zinc ribbon domain-containing protein [Planctomycetota bacterium]
MEAELEDWEYPDEDDEGDDEAYLVPCPECGHEMDADAECCPACGYWIVPDRSIPGIWKVVAVILVAIFILACLRLL